MNKRHRYDPEYATLDRVIPGALGGTYEPENLLLLCHECNEARGARSLSRFASGLT